MPSFTFEVQQALDDYCMRLTGFKLFSLAEYLKIQSTPAIAQIGRDLTGILEKYHIACVAGLEIQLCAIYFLINVSQREIRDEVIALFTRQGDAVLRELSDMITVDNDLSTQDLQWVLHRGLQSRPTNPKLTDEFIFDVYVLLANTAGQEQIRIELSEWKSWQTSLKDQKSITEWNRLDGLITFLLSSIREIKNDWVSQNMTSLTKLANDYIGNGLNSPLRIRTMDGLHRTLQDGFFSSLDPADTVLIVGLVQALHERAAINFGSVAKYQKLYDELNAAVSQYFKYGEVEELCMTAGTVMMAAVKLDNEISVIINEIFELAIERGMVSQPVCGAASSCAH